MKRFFLSVFLVAATFAADAQSSLKLPALSPTAKISQDFSVSNIEISYSRPSMRGRKVFGDGNMVPYDKVWRTGANGATKIKIGEDLEIAGQKVKAGEYALYTIPGKERWEVILNDGTGNWGTDGYSKDHDIARFTVKPATIDGDCQTFTIMITDITFTTCKIEMVWERTKIVLPVVARNADNIEVNIDKVINHPTIPYFQVANYYYESNKKLDLAASYVTKALEQDPQAYYMWYLKARIEKKRGNNDEAVAAARKSMEAAKGSANEAEYMRNNQKLIDDIKKMGRRRQEAEPETRNW